MTAPTARTTLVAISHLFLTDQRMGLAQLFCIGPSVVEASACRSRPSGGIHGTSAVGLDVIWNSVIRFRCSQDGARSEEHTSAHQSLMRIPYPVYSLRKITSRKTEHKTRYR